MLQTMLTPETTPLTTTIEPGVASLGTADFGVKPQGSFTVVTLKVTNIGADRWPGNTAGAIRFGGADDAALGADQGPGSRRGCCRVQGLRRRQGRGLRDHRSPAVPDLPGRAALLGSL